MQQTQYIAAWKSGVAVRWRGLTWTEFRQFTQQMAYSSPIEVYIDLYRAVLLDGPDVLSAPAGIVDYVGRTMLETNPFNGEYLNIKHALDVKRSTQSYLDHARALVAGIFRYTFEEIDTWDVDTFFDRVAKAEFIAGKAIEPEDPVAAAKAAADAKDPTKPKPRRQKRPMTEAQKVAWERVQERSR
ncbi:MAG: hypothetical protein ABSE84_17080 [Isosphaeraceae bacterium]